VVIDNPLDYHTFIWNQKDKLIATFSAVLSGGFDLGMLILDIPTIATMKPDTWLVTAEAFVKAHEQTTARAAVVATLPECLPETVAGRLSEAGIAPMAGLDDALTAFEAAAFIGRSWTSAAEPQVVRSVQKTGEPVLLSEHAAKQRLADFGLTIPQGLVCRIEDAAGAAQKLGFPVVVKASGKNLAHKTEAGGVALTLHSSGDVAAAAHRMQAVSAEVLVEPMITGAVCELIIGVKSDAQFGLALVVGAGGVFTELLKDTVTLLLPASRGEIERGLERLRIWSLLRGFRGRTGDSAAVVNAIAAVARFAEVHADALEELDVNPLLVMPEGQGAVAVDALIRMRE
jgi:acyl-CoA synthetase (NDP forming)